MHAVNLPDMPLLIDLPAPKFVASVELTRSELSDSGVGTQHFSYSASEWCRDSVQALFDSIKDYRGDSNRFYQRNNEAISRVIPYRGIDVIVDHSAVFKTLHADLNNGDVKDFMNSFAARSAVHRLTFAGLDVYGRALDRSLSEKASSPQGLWRNGSKSEKDLKN